MIRPEHKANVGQKIPVNLKQNFLVPKRLFLPGAVLFCFGILGAFFTNHGVLSTILAALGLVFVFVIKLVGKSLATGSHLIDYPLDKTLSDLKHHVTQAKYLGQQGTLGEVAWDQASHLESSYRFLMKALLQNFSPNELTFSRYDSAINTSVMSLHENLLHTTDLLKLLDLQTPPSPKTLGEVKDSLKANQSMLSGLDALAEALQGINRGDSFHEDFETKLKLLNDLADRAHKYSKN